MKSKEDELEHESEQALNQDSYWNQKIEATTDSLSVHISQSQLQQISPTALAYLGDAVYELYVRMFYLFPPKRPDTYHSLVVSQVRAETQAKIMRDLSPHLVSSELEIVRRGRNAAGGRRHRLEGEIYQQASSLETLIGYLYLTDCRRLKELLQKLRLEK
ncbi:ribonuclease III domain-containing protein [Iningainema tapete]|uniref:Mini-ribonuclease 3 n=1 Tax=Iningainema tapete BLCC-T55 TaxID=2748662 RepID=A0A8J6XQB9_9CYAN|nr:ribonuclease III [Iningainema tapete BLCC-T55]